eukprot:TRINITY_DN6760_c1_g2_i2.p1 TRINITY_DN6760_c1_g2~~TRINITY_DN6760_c1_g2_i2.p1  ORF type:complete len:1351 (-),score=257.66 TRINITY_DN6760_c1_g2_i2:26-4057(-)
MAVVIGGQARSQAPGPCASRPQMMMQPSALPSPVPSQTKVPVGMRSPVASQARTLSYQGAPVFPARSLSATSPQVSPGLPAQARTSLGQACASRPQPAARPSNCSARTQPQAQLSEPGQLRGYACMTTPQLLELCRSLDKSRSTMEKLLAQLINEQGKLLNHRGTLRTRIAEVEAAASAAKEAEPPLQTPELSSEGLAPAPAAKPAADAAAVDVAAAAAAMAAESAMSVESAAPKAAPRLLRPSSVEAMKEDDIASSAKAFRPATASSEAFVAFTGTGQGTNCRVQVGNSSTSSSSSKTKTLPRAAAPAPEEERAAAEFPGFPEVLSMPEELMAKSEPNGNIRLTWFYDEALLERLADLDGFELSFEVRQQSEGAGGRLRTRMHSRAVQLPEPRQDVGEQQYLVEGCAPGRTYTFSVRALLRRGKADQDGDSQTSDFCRPVSATSAGEPRMGLVGGSLSAPVSSLAGLRGSFQSLQAPLGGSMHAPCSLASTLSSTQRAEALSLTSTQQATLTSTQRSEASSLTVTQQAVSTAGSDQCPSCCSVYLADALFCRKCGQKRGEAPSEHSAAAPLAPDLTPEGPRLAPAASQGRSSLQDSAGFLRKWLAENKLASSKEGVQNGTSAQAPRTPPSERRSTLSQEQAAFTLPSSTPAEKAAADPPSPSSPSDQGFLRRWLRERQQSRASEPNSASPATELPTSPSSPAGAGDLARSTDGAAQGPCVHGQPMAVPGRPSSFTAAPPGGAKPAQQAQRPSLVEGIMQKAHHRTASPPPPRRLAGGEPVMPLAREVNPAHRNFVAAQPASMPESLDIDVTRPPGDAAMGACLASQSGQPLTAEPCQQAVGDSSGTFLRASVVASPAAPVNSGPQARQLLRPSGANVEGQSPRDRALQNVRQAPLMGVPRSQSFPAREKQALAGSMRVQPHKPQRLVSVQQHSNSSQQVHPQQAQPQQPQQSQPQRPQQVQPQHRQQVQAQPVGSGTVNMLPTSSSFPSQCQQRLFPRTVSEADAALASVVQASRQQQATPFQEQLGGTRPLQAVPQLGPGSQQQQLFPQETITSLPAPASALVGLPPAQQSFPSQQPAQQKQQKHFWPENPFSPMPAMHGDPPGSQGNFFGSAGASPESIKQSLSETAASLLAGRAGPFPFAAQKKPFGSSFSPLGALPEAGGEMFASGSLEEAPPPPRGAPSFEPPAPPRSAPSLDYDNGGGSRSSRPMRGDFPRWDDPSNQGAGMDITKALGAPTASRMSRSPPALPEELPEFEAPDFMYGGSRGGGGGTAQHVLQVRMADNRWESLNFGAGDDIERQGRHFIQKAGLKGAFMPGLVAKMRQMMAIGQDYACTDIVDLI